MKRRLLAVLLAVAMLATSFVALPVFAAVESENVGTLEIATGKDTQTNFSKGYTGTVTVSFDLTMGEGTQGTDLYLAASGADRMSAKPYLQITQEGGVYAQGATKVGNVSTGTATSVVWTYDTVAGTYTVSIGGGAASDAISCGAQADVGAFAYKTRQRSMTVANLTVSGETGSAAEPFVPDLPMNDGARTYYGFEQAYEGIVTLDFDLNIGAGSRFNMWLEATGQNGYESAGNPWLQFVAEGDLYLQDAIKVGKINHGQDNHFQVVVNLATKTFTVAINNGAACEPVAFTGDMADIAGFDYRMQNTNGYIDNLVVSAVAAPVEPEEPEVPEVPFDNKVSASLSGEETVIYPDDVTFDVVLSKVVDLNVLALGFEYDPAVLTFKDIVLEQEDLEEIIPLNVNEVDGKISVVYGIKNEAITADDDTVWATLVFESVEPTEDEDVTATVDFTHFTASGVVNNGENAVQFETEILVDSVTTVVTLEEEISFDVNKDGKIDLADLSLVLFNFNSQSATACDVVRDGIVDVADVVAMVSAIRETNPDLLPPAIA